MWMWKEAHGKWKTTMAIIVAERLREWIKSRSESTQRELLVSMRWKLIWIGVGVHKTVFISFIPHQCCNEKHRSCGSGQTQLWMIEYLGCSSLCIQVYTSRTPWPVLHLLSLSLRRYTPDHPVNWPFDGSCTQHWKAVAVITRSSQTVVRHSEFNWEWL